MFSFYRSFHDWIWFVLQVLQDAFAIRIWTFYTNQRGRYLACRKMQNSYGVRFAASWRVRLRYNAPPVLEGERIVKRLDEPVKSKSQGHADEVHVFLFLYRRRLILFRKHNVLSEAHSSGTRPYQEARSSGESSATKAASPPLEIVGLEVRCKWNRLSGKLFTCIFNIGELVPGCIKVDLFTNT